MKRIYMLLVAVATFGFAACGGASSENAQDEATGDAQEQLQEVESDENMAAEEEAPATDETAMEGDTTHMEGDHEEGMEGHGEGEEHSHDGEEAATEDHDHSGH
ncbi:MAG: hypothetical protein F6K11_08545 [Leptolyngbya sp. SIO3F4]|nr:hypothetical protein [Leptolyngbya sp. SIO3F4]